MYYLPSNKTSKLSPASYRTTPPLEKFYFGSNFVQEPSRATPSTGKATQPLYHRLYCKPVMQVVEVDGAYHFEAAQRIKDRERHQAQEEMRLFSFTSKMSK
ncbi:MAG TPA: hypothetical protein VF609_14565 [Flavisolibacter sp.]